VTTTKRRRNNLFQQGRFKLHSGEEASWKIVCEALTDRDIITLGTIAHEFLPPFGQVVGIPDGGMRLAKVMRNYVTKGPTLIVDDVFTTGKSFIEMRETIGDHNALGLVIFVRTQGSVVPYWIRAIWMFGLINGHRKVMAVGRHT
jgi:hypothetical protein